MSPEFWKQAIRKSFKRVGVEMKRKFTYTVILQPESDPEFAGYYNASVPALPGCFSYGESREAALRNIREAIELYIEDMEADLLR